MLSLRRIATPLLLALALPACGDEPVVRAPGGALAVTLTDYRIVPMRVRSAKRRLTVRVTNEGRLPHNLEIHGPGGRVRMRISTLLPGESDTGRVRLPKGRWVMLCKVGNHEELGQHAELVVG